MSRSNLSLVTLQPEHKEQLLLMMEEYRAAGEDRYDSTIEQIRDDFSAYLQWTKNLHLGQGLRAGIVAETIFWLLRDDNTFIGSSRLRHQLTPALRQEGGHIGYDIRPSQRNRGYGTRMLGLTLEKAKEMGLKRVLITCDTDNVGSVRVIEKNGGLLENTQVSGQSGKLISRYWIELE